MSQVWPDLIAAFDQLWRDPERADVPALVDETDVFSYRQLHAAVGARAGWLQHRGVRRSDRVALVIDRSATLAITILAVMAVGACPCPVEPRLSAEEALRRSRVAAFRWVVFDSANEGEALNCGLPNACCLSIGGDGVDPPTRWPGPIEPGDDGLLLFTSGSSGKPKGVLLNHRGLLSNATGIVAHTALDANDRLLHVMPLFHTNGVNNQLLAPLLAGSCVVLASRFKAEDVPALLHRHRPTVVTGVPTMYSRMLPLEFSRQSLATLRMLRCGSAPITEDLHRRIEAKFGLPLVVSYGLSEATCTSTMNPPQRRKIGSVGTVLQGQSVFLRGPGGNTVSGPDFDGEICISGPSLMSGYLHDGANGVAEPLGDVLRTGDLGRFDSDGYLFITGRLKDVIIRGGENLSPNQIEEVIAALPGVAACCVVGRADADLGEVPVAFVVRQPGAVGAALSADAIECTVLARLSRVHQPAQTLFVDTLPEMAIGKVDRKKVREWAQA